MLQELTEEQCKAKKVQVQTIVKELVKKEHDTLDHTELKITEEMAEECARKNEQLIKERVSCEAKWKEQGKLVLKTNSKIESLIQKNEELLNMIKVNKTEHVKEVEKRNSDLAQTNTALLAKNKQL